MCPARSGDMLHHEKLDPVNPVRLPRIWAAPPGTELLIHRFRGYEPSRFVPSLKSGHALARTSVVSCILLVRAPTSHVPAARNPPLLVCLLVSNPSLNIHLLSTLLLLLPLLLLLLLLLSHTYRTNQPLAAVSLPPPPFPMNPLDMTYPQPPPSPQPPPAPSSSSTRTQASSPSSSPAFC